MSYYIRSFDICQCFIENIFFFFLVSPAPRPVWAKKYRPSPLGAKRGLLVRCASYFSFSFCFMRLLALKPGALVDSR